MEYKRLLTMRYNFDLFTDIIYNQFIGPMGRVFTNGPVETEVQSQVETYQRLKKWYLKPPCLTLSIIK